MAANYKITGYVRNMYTGMVELIIEGPPQEIKNYLFALAKAMKGMIADIEVQKEPYTGDFDHFGVRY